MNSSTMSQSHCSGSSRVTGPSESARRTEEGETEVEKKWVARKRTEEVVEELAAVFVRVEAVVDIRLKTRVHMAIIKLPIKNQEQRICPPKTQ